MSQLIKWLRFDTVEEVYNWSRWMMDLHGLQDWKVEIKNRKQFPAGDRSCSGICYGATETICIDRSHALGVRMGLVMDTVWHEIAHALVGIQAGSLSKKYALAVDWMCDNNGTLKQAAGKFGIPQDKMLGMCQKKRGILPTAHGKEWARIAVSIGCRITTEFQSHQRVLRTAMAEAGIKDTHKADERKLLRAVKRAEAERKGGSKNG